ncbi:zinc finger protein 282-like isoform X3 [Ambystoma mexicanum]|uniref:zinc finger protein 282-like isoform X3 n=1 Tax=Ambystoma mexicanum TaxID=8296 RepID=UPI0037E79A96
MKTRRQMSQQISDKAPVTFQDVAAYFSEEEWKLLHDWQRELYKNVMKEIHQALLSLGPVIATSIFSLSVKEKQDLCHMETDANRTQDIYLPGSKIDNCDVLFGINRDENQYLKDCQEMDERIINDSFSTAFPVSNFENVLRLEHELQSSLMASEDADGAMSGPHPSSVQETVFPVISVKIKQEEEAYSVDHQNFEKTEPIYIQRALPFSNTEPATSFTEDADGPESSIVHATALGWKPFYYITACFLLYCIIQVAERSLWVGGGPDNCLDINGRYAIRFEI